jgi:hypothetical protein
MPGTNDAVGACGGQVVGGARAGLAQEHQFALGCRQSLHVHAVVAVLAAVHGVRILLCCMGVAAPCRDQSAVQQQVPPYAGGGDGPLQGRGEHGQTLDALIDVAPSGVGGDPEVGCELGERVALDHPGEHHDRLVPGGQGAPETAGLIPSSGNQILARQVTVTTSGPGPQGPQTVLSAVMTALIHALLLAESEAALPPIIVHRLTVRVVDGMHRLRAAQEWGERQDRGPLLRRFRSGCLHDGGPGERVARTAALGCGEACVRRSDHRIAPPLVGQVHRARLRPVGKDGQHSPPWTPSRGAEPGARAARGAGRP